MGQFDDFFADLHGQLAGRHQDQGLRLPFFLLFVEPFENRNGEGGRFAGSGAGLAQHVDAGQGAGNQAGLNGGRSKIFDLDQRREHHLGKAKVSETGVRRGFGLCGVNERFRHEQREVLGYPRRGGSANISQFDGLTLSGDQSLVNGGSLATMGD